MYQKETREKVFLNFSNHPSDSWTDAQTKAALENADRIVDIPFPPVNPAMDETALDSLAEEMTKQILSYSPVTVMCQGEFGLSFSVIKKLLAKGVTVVHACSERKVHVNGNIKTVQFDFVQFRKFM